MVDGFINFHLDSGQKWPLFCQCCCAFWEVKMSNWKFWDKGELDGIEAGAKLAFYPFPMMIMTTIVMTKIMKMFMMTIMIIYDYHVPQNRGKRRHRPRAKGPRATILNVFAFPCFEVRGNSIARCISCNGERELEIFHFQDHFKGKGHFLIRWVLLKSL